ncbi:MAG: hypothetical protein ACRDPS_01435 [Nocardioides sp.]|uniref:hypothetical protein n=1 Tax=Nocardioides sp. TaxID=35761 RepID=UPI003D6B82CB
MPEQIPEGSVVITPSEQYQRTAEQFGTITEQLSGIKQTLNPVAAQVAEHDAYLNSLRLVGLPESLTTIKGKVEGVERVQWRSMGFSAGIGAAVALVGGALVQTAMKAFGG